MTAAASKREFAVEVVRTLTAAGYRALWAGGCVRDLLRNREPDDFDIASNAPPEEVRRIFGRRRTLGVGESFGVVIVLGERNSGLQVEVAAFRAEGPYADGRRPDSVRFATPEEDAQRRDFTINGMFYDPLTEDVLDYVGGERDLQDGVLRAIGDPRARMTEDKLRMLRAVRFAAVLDFELDPDTADAVRELAPQILVVSWERITQELRKMLRHAHRRRAMRLARQLGLLERILPELAPLLTSQEPTEWNHLLDTLDALVAPTFEAAAAVLLRSLSPPSSAAKSDRGDAASDLAAACRRLKLSNREREEIVWLVEHRDRLAGAEQLPIAALKRLLVHPLIDDLLNIAAAEARARNEEPTAVQFVRDYLQRTPIEELDPPPLLTGEDLLALGLRPGPRFKELLSSVRDAQLEGDVRTRDEAMARAASLVRGSSER